MSMAARIILIMALGLISRCEHHALHRQVLHCFQLLQRKSAALAGLKGDPYAPLWPTQY